MSHPIVDERCNECDFQWAGHTCTAPESRYHECALTAVYPPTTPAVGHTPQFELVENDLRLLGIVDAEDTRPGWVISLTRAEYQAGLTPQQANLIAAAPAMLDACKEAARYLQFNRGNGSSAYDKCVEAIQQATK